MIRKLLLVFLTLSGVASAQPECIGGTFASYAALGSTGCTLHRYGQSGSEGAAIVLSNFAFDISTTGGAAAPSGTDLIVRVTSMPSGFTGIAFFHADPAGTGIGDLKADPGKSVTISVRYLLTIFAGQTGTPEITKLYRQTASWADTYTADPTHFTFPLDTVCVSGIACRLFSTSLCFGAAFGSDYSTCSGTLAKPVWWPGLQTLGAAGFTEFYSLPPDPGTGVGTKIYQVGYATLLKVAGGTSDSAGITSMTFGVTYACFQSPTPLCSAP